MTPLSRHIPVMLTEVVAALAPRDGGVYVDGTFGRGGYTEALLQAARTTVYAIDRDPEAIAAGASMVAAYAPRLHLISGTFGAMDSVLAEHGVAQVDGVALDIGVSSPQLDDATRGFSFREDGPLDMRMSREGRSAADWINETPEKELADLIYLYGEERFSRRVARRIVEARTTAPIARTAQLAEIVRRAVPKSGNGIDPATRTFQALRIAVNDELGELQRGLEAAERLLAPGGRLAVVSFHSLEDRCVKAFLRARSQTHTGLSRHLPANDTQTDASFRLMNNKPQVPSAADVHANPRARSARLRVAERTEAPVRKEKVA
jgi:16S rRNA (cytosine1402-N4)-methyltransferase